MFIELKNKGEPLSPLEGRRQGSPKPNLARKPKLRYRLSSRFNSVVTLNELINDESQRSLAKYKGECGGD